MIYLPKSVLHRMKVHEYLRTLDFEDLKGNPVCTRCERVALRDEGWSEDRIGHCPACGHRGVMEVTLHEYAEKMMYR